MNRRTDAFLFCESRQNYCAKKGASCSTAEAEKGEQQTLLAGQLEHVSFNKTVDISGTIVLFSPQGLEVAIRNKIEQEVTQKASSSLHKPLSVVKGPDGKARPGTSTK